MIVNEFPNDIFESSYIPHILSNKKGKTLVGEMCVMGCVVDQKTYFLDSFSFEHQQFSNPQGTYE
jgi:hypothetical protein